MWDRVTGRKVVPLRERGINLLPRERYQATIDIDKEIEKRICVKWSSSCLNGRLCQFRAPEHTTQILAEDRSLSPECELGWETVSAEWIEFHYTQIRNEVPCRIKRWHRMKVWVSIISAITHVIKENGEITNTRDERMYRSSRQVSSNNHRLIQIVSLVTISQQMHRRNYGSTTKDIPR